MAAPTTAAFHDRASGRRGRGDDHAVGVALGLLEVVGGENDGLAFLCLVAQGVPEFVAGVDVHAGGGLVQDEEVGAGQDCQRETHALLLSAGAQPDLTVLDLSQPGLLHDFAHDLIQWRGPRMQPGYSAYGLLDRDVGEKSAGLHHRAQARRLRGQSGRPAKELDGAAGWFGQS